jgi:hypothetical protein
MSSDATGEIYVITASDGGSVDAMTVVGNSTNGGSSPKKGGAVRAGDVRSTCWAVIISAVVVALMLA